MQDIYIVINKILGIKKRIFKGIGDMSPLAILFLIPGYILGDMTNRYYIVAPIIITIVFVFLLILINRIKKNRIKNI